ncbi:MAG: MarR family transcriptional regulator [Candidatus Andeanibacterium colombiense]|uniref:MarR family transcriptional regulator n=1 Tax=Candidatus Andeanibacterium colombiense TaxID=3121345 RepID=A0AAJ5X8B3_9SPHN|nr:MAG: MarR family transcriptional regulator [Sphingomonadaceae bacterium]
MENVHNTHILAQYRDFHLALLEIVAVMSRPQRDEALIRAAGIRLDRALFPLVVVIERFGPIGIVDLADRIGRDHTTVSRQVAKLETLGLVVREADPSDRRVRRAAIAPEGKAMTDRIDRAREQLGLAVFADWEERDFDDLVRLMGKFAASFRDVPERP